MARLRIRLRFNPGREGSPMDKLGEFSSQTEKFLRSLANDLGIVAKKGQWLAKNFTNESVAFDGEFADSVPDEIALKGLHAMELISGEEPLEACNRGVIGYGTITEFSRINKILDPDEKFYIGLYRDGEDKPAENNWREISYSRIAEIRQLLDAPFVTSGSIQAIIHAWASGANPPFLHLRDLASGGLVRCNYDEKLYPKIHTAHKQAHTTIHVYGDITWDRSNNSITEINAKDIEISETLTEAEFLNLFGSMPKFTGELSTADYIDWLKVG